MAVDVVIGLDSLAFVALVGVAITYKFLVPAVQFEAATLEYVRRRAWRLFWLCLGALWATSLAWLWTRSAAVSGRDLWEAWTVVPIVLSRTHFGAAWWLRAVALLWLTCVLLAMFWHDGPARRAGIVALLFGLAWIAASRSASGHAAAAGDWTLREFMDWLHFMSVAVWGGSLVASLLLVFPRLRRVCRRYQAHFAARFSLLASWALAGVVITGAYGTWQMLPSISAFWSTRYGQLLALKLLLVFVMMLCGALNHYHLVPRLQRIGTTSDSVIRRLQASVRVEAGLLLVVLAVTALLLGSMPPTPA